MSDEVELATLRSLKIKFLTKGTVTVNGAHFMHPAVLPFLQKHPAILEHRLLLPALREDKADFGDYVSDFEAEIAASGMTSVALKEAVAFVGDRIDTVLPWRAEQAQDAFRDRLLFGLSNPNSLVHRSLLNVPGLRG
jgi:hypothetical protein